MCEECTQDIREQWWSIVNKLSLSLSLSLSHTHTHTHNKGVVLSWPHLILNMMPDLRSFEEWDTGHKFDELVVNGFCCIGEGLKNRELWRLIWVWLMLIWICWDWLELGLSLLNFDFDLWRCEFPDLGSCSISSGFFPLFIYLLKLIN